MRAAHNVNTQNQQRELTSVGREDARSPPCCFDELGLGSDEPGVGRVQGHDGVAIDGEVLRGAGCEQTTADLVVRVKDADVQRLKCPCHLGWKKQQNNSASPAELENLRKRTQWLRTRDRQRKYLERHVALQLIEKQNNRSLLQRW
jgi:hypothetical protein